VDPLPAIRIKTFTRYCEAGSSSRIRVYQFRDYLEEKGFEVQISPLLDRDYLLLLYKRKQRGVRAILRGILNRVRELRSLKGYDLIWVEKELFPWFPLVAERFLCTGIPYILDYDDAIFHNYDLHPRWAVRRLLGKKIDTIMTGAAMVIVGNDYLAQRAIRAGARRVEILPSVVDLSKYPGVQEKTREEPFTIGWIGSPSTTKHLLEAESALKQVCRNRGGKIVLIGAGENPFSGLMATLCEWDGEREAEEIGNFDVGIMPLPDNPWERGKCGFKLIQYMACGKPVVASPVGVNREIVVDGVTGYLASSYDEWVRALERLKSDPELRKTMGANGRRMVEEKYCLQVTAPRLHRLLLEAAGRA
jgi:glycosyltransferase involved in cell wall biosynthesis